MCLVTVSLHFLKVKMLDMIFLKVIEHVGYFFFSIAKSRNKFETSNFMEYFFYFGY